MYLHPITNLYFINHKMSCKIQVIQQLSQLISRQFYINILLVCLFYAILVCVSVLQPAPDKLKGSNHLTPTRPITSVLQGIPHQLLLHHFFPLVLLEVESEFMIAVYRWQVVYQLSSSVQFNSLKNSNQRPQHHITQYQLNQSQLCEDPHHQMWSACRNMMSWNYDEAIVVGLALTWSQQ